MSLSLLFYLKGEVMIKDAVDVYSEVLYYDMDTDITTVFSVVLLKSGWTIGVLTRVDRYLKITDFKIVSPSDDTCH